MESRLPPEIPQQKPADPTGRLRSASTPKPKMPINTRFAPKLKRIPRKNSNSKFKGQT